MGATYSPGTLEPAEITGVKTQKTTLLTQKWFVQLKHTTFLGAFVKLRKATITFVTSLHLFAWKNSAPIGRIFMKFCV
jgi:hypothetical protein